MPRKKVKWMWSSPGTDPADPSEDEKRMSPRLIAFYVFDVFLLLLIFMTVLDTWW